MDSGNPRTSPYICEKKAKAEKRAIEYWIYMIIFFIYYILKQSICSDCVFTNTVQQKITIWDEWKGEKEKWGPQSGRVREMSRREIERK